MPKGHERYNNKTNAYTGQHQFVDRPIRLSGASWVEPSGAAILFDDFLSDTLDADDWDAVAVQATGGTRFAHNTAGGDPTAGHGGWIVATTGTGDNDTEGLFGQLAWAAERAGNGLLVYETSISLPSVAGIGFSAGLTDARTEAATLFQFITTTWTTVPTDAVALSFDTDATTDLVRGIGVKADVDTTAVVGSAPAATTATRLRIEVDSTGKAYFYQGATSAPDPTYLGSAAAAVTATVLLCPFVEVSAKAGSAAKSIEVDYVFVACGR